MNEIKTPEEKLKIEIFDLQVQLSQIRKSLQDKINQLNILMQIKKED